MDVPHSARLLPAKAESSAFSFCLRAVEINNAPILRRIKRQRRSAHYLFTRPLPQWKITVAFPRPLIIWHFCRVGFAHHQIFVFDDSWHTWTRTVSVGKAHPAWLFGAQFVGCVEWAKPNKMFCTTNSYNSISKINEQWWYISLRFIQRVNCFIESANVEVRTSPIPNINYFVNNEELTLLICIHPPASVSNLDLFFALLEALYPSRRQNPLYYWYPPYRFQR